MGWGQGILLFCDGGCFCKEKQNDCKEKTKGGGGTNLKMRYLLCKTVYICDASRHGSYLGGPLPYPDH
jgi:hypothetical protein